MTSLVNCRRVAALALTLNVLVGVAPAHADLVTFRFSGSIFGVADPDGVFGTEPGDTYTVFLTYDPDLLTGVDLISGSTRYTKAAGDSSIRLSFSSSGGDSFVSDDSFEAFISLRNTPDYNVTMTPGDGRDSISIEAWFDPVTRFRLSMLESPGSNPLSSNDLPTATFGGGPGTWNVSELDVDRMFGNISGSVSSAFELVAENPVGVPEPSVLSLCLSAALLARSRARRGARSAKVDR